MVEAFNSKIEMGQPFKCNLFVAGSGAFGDHLQLKVNLDSVNSHLASKHSVEVNGGWWMVDGQIVQMSRFSEYFYQLLCTGARCE